MRKGILTLIILALLILPVSATSVDIPEAPSEAQKHLPSQSSSFWEDLWFVFQSASMVLHPAVSEATGICFRVVVVVILVALLRSISGNVGTVFVLVAAVAIAVLLLQPADALIQLGVDTVQQQSQYGKLLLPVMTAALAAQGNTSTSAALHIGTAFFDAILSTAISVLLVPLVYIFIFLSIASAAINEPILKSLKDFSKWLFTWGLKLIMYTFCGYLGLTNVVAGSVDAAAIKATKITISGTVPVIGGIISDASETILVSAGLLKNSAGIYGLLVIFALFISPFIKIAVQYILLKISSAICKIYDTGDIFQVVSDFTTAMGFTLAMTAAGCVIQLLSTVCFMKGGT